MLLPSAKEASSPLGFGRQRSERRRPPLLKGSNLMGEWCGLKPPTSTPMVNNDEARLGRGQSMGRVGEGDERLTDLVRDLLGVRVSLELGIRFIWGWIDLGFKLASDGGSVSDGGG